MPPKLKGQKVFAITSSLLLSLGKAYVGWLTGLVDEKKSISFPIVKGILRDTEEETSKRPIATSNGFRSILARDRIFLNEETFR